MPKVIFFSLLFVHKGWGSIWNGPFVLGHFFRFRIFFFVQNLHHVCIHPKQLFISKDNDQKVICFKMAAKNEFSFREKKSRDQNIKTHTFSKKFFNKIGLKVKEFKNMKIFCIKRTAKTSSVTLCKNVH